MNIINTVIVKMIFGSHLYGTDTESSDKDFKGVFLPTKEQLFLGKIPKTISYSTKEGQGKNDPSDVDTELYSLHYFIHMACEGETQALDMLHAPAHAILDERTRLWHELSCRRELFYTKNLKAFVGYARKQASKYGIKGSRLNDAARVAEFLAGISYSARLEVVWNGLPKGEHIHKHEELSPRLYEVCGRKMQETVTVKYALDIVTRFRDNYGARAESAARNEGVDWKAMSHAIRAALQVKEIFTEGNIIFPLREAEYLKKVKAGVLDYSTEVAPRLEALIVEIEELAEKSSLRAEVDRKYWDHFIVSAVKEWIL